MVFVLSPEAIAISLTAKILKKFPNKTCFYFNNIWKKGFKVKKEKNKFKFVFENGITLESYDDIVTELAFGLKGYLENYKPKKGDTIMDGGAYVGSFTIYAAKAVGKTGKIIAFEPDPENHEKLIKNLKLNKINNVKIIRKGLWSKKTTLKFQAGQECASTFITDTNKKNLIKIPVTTIDEEIRKQKLDFIKMDVEGAEIEAIKGAEKTLKNNNVKIAIASYHMLNGEQTRYKLEKQLKKMGYTPKTKFSGQTTTYAEKN